MLKIAFNRPFLTGNEINYINDVLSGGKICGNGVYTQKCQNFFREWLGSRKCLLTTSCTDALEMCAMLADIKPGDEVIVPSYTFVSTALAFTRQGAKVVFADSLASHPCVDPAGIEQLITPKTKAVVVVHYAGVACDMDAFKKLAHEHNLLLIEDAAQAVDSYYITREDASKTDASTDNVSNGTNISETVVKRFKRLPLGSIGDLAAFSFHETKNIQCGEGGVLAINNPSLVRRAEILWEKGTNRAEFFRGEINKYGWVDTGSSFLPNEYTAAFLWAQIEQMRQIQQWRKELWNRYYNNLYGKTPLKMPFLPYYATNNAHMFYVTTQTPAERTALIKHLKDNGINAVFHYLSLHKSKFAVDNGMGGANLPMADYYTDCLVRLPLFGALTEQEVDYVTKSIIDFYNKKI
ncbi:MAG: dTDP-4-amino-4,6-dideoxygalactose transaminase [Bacteroidales bacterium]|nr:dTDP-4-amino-4,6-dideoxygalactose transaminase [Bacteroidales bacterium]